MIEKTATYLAKYSAKKLLNNYQWNAIFRNAKEDIFSALENGDSELIVNIKILFNDDTIDELISLLDRNCGFGFYDLIKAKLEEKSSQLDISKEDKTYYIDEFIKDVESNLKLRFPDFYRDIMLEKSVAGLEKGQESIKETLKNFSDAGTEIYNIWQYDALLRRYNKYGIDTDFFDYGEGEIDKNILEKLSKNEVLYIQAPSKEEGLYYILRLLKSNDNICDNAFVVTSLKSWNSLEGKIKNKILIPFFATQDIPVLNQNTTVYIYDKNINLRNKDIIDIPNRTRTNLSNMLSKYIGDYNKINKLMTANMSIFPILKREIFDGNMSAPKWECTDLKKFVPALLLGSWSDKTGDIEILELISGKNFYEYIEELKEFIDSIDPFAIRFKGTSYNEYRVADLEQAWYYVGKSIKKEDLSNLELILQEVIPAQTKKVENGICTVDCGKYSEILKEGLVKTLIFLNRYSDINSDLVGISEKYVDLLLNNVNWDNISDLLPELVEAAPSAFVCAVELAIKNKSEFFMDLFKSKGQTPFDYCNYPKLLVALEKGLFINDIRYSCINILEDLCQVKIESNIVNSPIHTLSNFFCAFFDEVNVGNNKRAKLLDIFVQKYPQNAWLVLKNILPKLMQAHYDYLSKPLYLEHNRNNKPQLRQNIIDLYKEYYKIAFKCAGNDLSKWKDLYSDCIFVAYGLKEEAFLVVQNLIKDISIPDDIKYMFANTVRKFLYDCRYFKRKYIEEIDVENIENKIYKQIVYSNANYKYLYAFEDEYKPLHPSSYEKENYIKDWEERQKIRECKQVKILKMLKGEELEDFLKLLKDNNYVGESLAVSINYKIDVTLCNFMYVIGKKGILSQYFATIFYKEGTEFAFQQLNTVFANCDVGFKYILLQSLNVDSAFIMMLKKQPEEIENYYWKHIRRFIKSDDYNFNKYCFDKLLQNGNIYSAWDLTRFNDYKLDDYLKFFQALIDSTNDGFELKLSGYDIVTIFEKIYKMNIDDTETQQLIVRYEIAFSKAFRFDNRDIKPKFLYNQLAFDPKISTWIIKLAYKQDNGEEQILTEEEVKIAKNAWRVLLDVNFCPCVDDTGHYHAAIIESWLKNFLVIINSNNQCEIGMYLLGRFFAHFPKRIYKTWLPKEICKFIEENRIYGGKKNISLSRGFCLECYNSVGARSIDAGRENIPLIAEYISYAKEAELNYPFTAEIFRRIANDFKHESQERRERAVHEY